MIRRVDSAKLRQSAVIANTSPEFLWQQRGALVHISPQEFLLPAPAVAGPSPSSAYEGVSFCMRRQEKGKAKRSGQTGTDEENVRGEGAQDVMRRPEKRDVCQNLALG